MGTFSRKGKKTTSGRKQSMPFGKVLGVYVEIDLESKRITIGKGMRKLILNSTEAKVLSETLNHQIQLLFDK